VVRRERGTGVLAAPLGDDTGGGVVATVARSDDGCAAGVAGAAG
jgi:hypothetical protein